MAHFSFLRKISARGNGRKIHLLLIDFPGEVKTFLCLAHPQFFMEELPSPG
jgi:hypothetical protein